MRTEAGDCISWNHLGSDMRCIQPATLHTPSPSGFIHPTCSACQLDAFQLGPRPSGGFLLRVSRPPCRGFSASRLPNSPEDTDRVTDIHVSPTSHTHRAATERQPPSLTWVQSPITSNSASPLNPMRQKAEKEAETNRLRSGCTLDRRHECYWHYLEQCLKTRSHKVTTQKHWTMRGLLDKMQEGKRRGEAVRPAGG